MFLSSQGDNMHINIKLNVCSFGTQLHKLLEKLATFDQE